MKNRLTITLVITLISLLFIYSESYAQFAHKINKQRRYDEISWLITHNANNNRIDGPSGFFGCLGGGNQSAGILKQLQDGVRSFMVDIYRVNGQLRLKHGAPNMCMMDAKNFNNILANWLQTHPQDIITLHIESGANLGKSGLDDIFFGRRSGYKNMSSFIYRHNAFVSPKRPAGSGADTYPSVQEMLNQRKQLVIFSERNFNSDIYRHEFATTVQNRFRAGQVNELFSADKFVKDRGVDHKTVLTVNHFVGDAPTFNGDVNKSRAANKDVQRKAITAWFMFGHRPSISVDYYNLSNGAKPMNQIDEVNRINEVRGRFINRNNPGRHVRDVKTYFAEFKNGSWRKIKNIEQDGRRASWHVFYSFPAQSNDNRAIFFEHPSYNFNPTHIRIGDYKGAGSRTFVKNVVATRKVQTRSLDNLQIDIDEADITIYPVPSIENQLTLAYNQQNRGDITLGLYDLSGKLVEEILNKEIAQGSGEIIWKAKTKNLNGFYIVMGTINNQSYLKKVLFK
ncbi:T9SS type A sorting domain-containing protein [Aquimarina sp. ERC-38]|uniref:T9SS type A sorting domain-containing protein n=1 Tax=Aquimarina sp. ERC-38 TaxID=2949996 RepID=UPI0022473433|nr:T9SS type A sorting domain-containing protein [Aquimarina sp. ERC-38]UZO81319.1 T9SS type A sorting domain-containing protein [Aquimarina sp. ERC-38]